MASLASYGHGEPGYGNAYTISSIYHGGQIKISASHITQPSGPSGPIEHDTNRVRSYSVTDTVDTFRRGAGAFRNLKDWAKEKRDDLIRHANEKAVLSETVSPTNDNDTDSSPALSFMTAVSETEAYIMSQEYEGSNALEIF